MTSTSAQIRSNPMKSWWENSYARIMTFMLVYFLAVGIGVWFITEPEGLSVIWPASGVALAALLLSPRREWPVILASIFVINVLSNIVSGSSLAVSAGFAFANTAEPALGGAIMVWLRKDRITFTHLSDVLALAVVATIANALTALLGSLIPTIAFGSLFRDAWLTWWILDGLSILVITPFIVTWATSEIMTLDNIMPAKWVETIIWFLTLGASTWFMFGVSGVDIYIEQRPYMLYPVLVWGALRLSPRTSATAQVLASIIALIGTMAGTGTYPLGGHTTREFLIGVQAFFAVASITTLMLSASITERKDAAKKLAERNLFIESVVNTSPDILYIYDIVERKNIYSNDGIQNILGYSTGEVLEMGEQLIPSLMHPDDFKVYLQETYPKYLQARDGELITHQYRMKHRNGKWRTLESNELIYLRQPDGSPRQIFGVIRDITERKRAETLLQESEKRLQDVVNAAPYGAHTYQLHPDGSLVFISANRSANVILGMDHEQFIGKTIEEAFPALTETEVPSAYRHVASSGKPYYQEQIAYDEQGIVGAFEVHGLQISPNFMTAFFRDVTERKKAEEALRENKARLDLALRSNNIGVWRWEIAENKRHFDDQACHLLGIDPETFSGTADEFFKAVHPDDWETIKTAHAHTMEQDAPYEPDYRAIWPDGSIHYITARGKLVRDEQGNPVRINGIIWDITARKQVEAERERLVDELERKNRELESLVYVASHDLRSPLVNIQGFGQNLNKYLAQISEMLQNAKTLEEFRTMAQPVLTERTPKALHFIETSSAKMDSLIGGLLRISRVGRAVLQISQIDMEQLLRSILDSMAFQIEKANAKVDLETSLTPCQADKNLLNQVFSNLLDNALKYRASDRPLNITISSRIEARVVIYVIADTGLGIAPEDHEKIWELFHRIDADEGIPGEGLGLTLARRIVEHHGGRLRVESEPGVGSRFYVELPAVA